jgi:hypothetical protein
MPRAHITAGLVAVALALGVAFHADAQGHRGAPPGQLKKTTPPALSAATAGDVPPPSVLVLQPRTFGMWLDDASLAWPGSMWLTVSAVGWSAPAGHGVDMPAIGVAAGLKPRVQLSVSAPFSHVATNGTDETSNGVGDVYLGVKGQLAAPSDRGFGVSVAPTLELLGGNGASREMHLVLPLSFETGGGATRGYGSVGLFTRGALFASVALERHLTDRVAVTGALLQSWSTATSTRTADMGLRSSRTDVSGGVTAFVTPRAAVFGSVSRTISPIEFDSARFVVSGGVALVLTRQERVPIRPPQ